MKPTLVILAAGMGSRYGGLKQLDGVGPNHEPILEYSVFDALRAGFDKLVFVIRPDFADAFKAMVDHTFGRAIAVEYVYQELSMLPDGYTVPPQRQKPWGTGHAILCTESVITEPFSAINADDFYGANAFQLMGRFLSQAEDADLAQYAMVGYVLRNTLSKFGSVSRGLCHIEHNILQNVVELTKIEPDGDGANYIDSAGQPQPLTANEIVSMNMWGFTPSIFGHLRRLFSQFLDEKGHEPKSEFYIPTVVDTLIAQNQAQVTVLPNDDAWFGVTYREDRPYVQEGVQALIAAGRYPQHLWG
ncbi:MAG: nucleotidyltransferase [Anaerolineaceae bacterium]|nr:nucleotidyltransferase [Anaerolineaceae bacterium]MCB9101224.1 nucleotidyltransferase [Anaerolineales bacterium]